MPRMTRKAERAAWTERITGEKAPKKHKFNVADKEDRGGYASGHEMDVATNLHALATGGKILQLEEQVRIEVLPKNERFGAVTYIADFTYFDPEGRYHVLDAKGVKTAVYQVKKKMLWHFKKIAIEEV